MCVDEEIAPGVLWRMLILEWWHRNYLEGEGGHRTPPRLEFTERSTAPAQPTMA